MTIQVRNAAIQTANVRPVDMKLEVIVIPVSDVDRAKQFYSKLGWRLDAEFVAGDDFRIMQFTPPGSGASVIFGKGVTPAAPGSAQGLYLVVSDIEAARKELLDRGIEVSEVFHHEGDVRTGPDEPYLFGRPGQRPGSRAPHLPLVRLVQRSGRQRLAVAGGHRAASRARGPEPDDVRFGGRPGSRVPPCGGRARRAREADRWRARCELGRTGTPSTSWRSRPARSCRSKSATITVTGGGSPVTVDPDLPNPNAERRP